jgi:hypothetical protein
MLSNWILPEVDGIVLRGVAGAVVLLALAALSVWVYDRRKQRVWTAGTEPEAVPQRVPETDGLPCHRLGGQPAPRRGHNLICRGHEDNGPLAQRLHRTVAELAHMLPPHSFRLEVRLDCRGFAIEEPAFSLALVALLLHAAQIGRSHSIELSPLPPEHPLFQRGTSPQLLVRIATEAEPSSSPSHLADRALEACRAAGGEGSVEVDGELWLIWPTRRDAVGPDGPSLAVSRRLSAPRALPGGSP